MSTWSDLDANASRQAPSSSPSEDEDEVDCRLSPDWNQYRHIFERRGFHLDTVTDVKRFYELRSGGSQGTFGYYAMWSFSDDTALCKDPGLPDNLFRGRRLEDGRNIVVKAVHLRSREYDITRFLSSPPLRRHPMNHCIPVLDLIEVQEHGTAFIVMEEWSSDLIPEIPCCLTAFLRAMRSCIEHVVFMHHYDIAHLDISLRNLVTDYNGHYACIDYELSRRFNKADGPRTCGTKGTELPPELEKGAYSDPFKVDVWALGILILRASHLTGKLTPELIALTRPMLNYNYDHRPTAVEVLKTFDITITLDDGASHACLSDTSPP